MILDYIVDVSCCEDICTRLCHGSKTNRLPIIFNEFPAGELELKLPTDNFNGSRIGVACRVTSSSNLNEYLFKILLLCSCLRKANAVVILLMPFFPYARQNRYIPDATLSLNAPALLEHVANLLDGVVDCLVTAAPHCRNFAEFFKRTKIHVIGLEELLHHITLSSMVESQVENCLVALDSGIQVVAENLGKRLELPVVHITKKRTGAGESFIESVSGDVEGKHCILLDDMVDSGGTLLNGVRHLSQNGAKTISACFVHPVLGGRGAEILPVLAKEGLTQIAFYKTLKDHFKPYHRFKDEIHVAEFELADHVVNAVHDVLNNAG